MLLSPIYLSQLCLYTVDRAKNDNIVHINQIVDGGQKRVHSHGVFAVTHGSERFASRKQFYI